jgi:WD40 repeat protein
MFLRVMLFLLLFSSLTYAQDDYQTILVQSEAFSLRLSPDDQTAALFDNAIVLGNIPPANGLSIRLLDIESGEETGGLQGFTDFAYDAAFSPDGTKLASYHGNGDLYIWDVEAQEEINRIPTYFVGAGDVEWLSDDQSVIVRVAGSLYGRFMVIDTETGYITKTLAQPMPSQKAFMDNYTRFPESADLLYTTLVMFPDGERFITATGNDAIISWEIATNNRTILRPASEQKGLFAIRSLIVSADGRRLYYYDTQTKSVHVSDTQTNEEIAELPIVADGFAVSPDGEQIAWISRESSLVQIAPVDSPEDARTLVELPEGQRVIPNVTSIAFTSTGEQLVVGGFMGGESNAVYVVDVE